MAIRSTGRRGLFGLLCGAPVAIVAAGAKADDVHDPLVLVTLPPGVTATMKRHGDATQVDIIVEAVERKMAGRIARGKGSVGKAIEGTYGLQRHGR